MSVRRKGWRPTGLSLICHTAIILSAATITSHSQNRQTRGLMFTIYCRKERLS
jgi:hypothetical protein